MIATMNNHIAALAIEQHQVTDEIVSSILAINSVVEELLMGRKL